ncbi:hypothetical protein CA85_45060 [Allorhodopirellula solitaria]|uniref:DUF2752 domain-containing protein n=1 Tax=Allorhodopirellula solitaria TaxID=2527987 RepID=A0A5C5WYX4_9BACT|nr:hypothetical protein CA85_45060 [Allorhodopirellula solitaria]
MNPPEPDLSPSLIAGSQRDTSGKASQPKECGVGGLPAKPLRWAAAILALVLFTLLAMARSLSPAAAGLGTHQQLGLPPCSMRVLFGLRCPACGMTTSWSHWTRGQWWPAAQANVGGVCLAFVALAVALVACRVVWTGRLPSSRILTGLGWSIVATGAVTLVDWGTRLAW